MDPSPNLSVHTPRLLLEPMTLAHLPAYHALYSDPLSLTWSTQGPKSTLAASRAALIDRLRSDAKPWIEHYAILLRPDDARHPDPALDAENRRVSDLGSEPRFIGVVGTVRCSPPPEHRPEVGYRLHPDFWGRGLATEAVGAFVRLYWTLPERKNVECIAAIVDIKNLASTRVMEKLGARKGQRIVLELERLGTCEMETWIMDRPAKHN